jgi:pimeloyl-ACP methyl ester carboxylesterase
MLSACKPGAAAAGRRPIVFIHGMHGRADAFRAFLVDFGQRKEFADRPLLVFRYPGNDSLARSGKFLFNEVRRTLPDPAATVFVCHSAGGLVFRYYAERLGGGFSRGVLLGAPNGGARLVELKFLVDLAHFLCDLTGGLSHAVARALPEGRGQMTLDLHPDSLFLRCLDRSPRQAARYHIIFGEYLDGSRAFALRCAFAAGRRLLMQHAPGVLAQGTWWAAALPDVGRLRLPEEVLHGDLLVARASAVLPGAGRTTRLPVGHLRLTSDPQAIQCVLSSIRELDSRPARIVTPHP